MPATNPKHLLKDTLTRPDVYATTVLTYLIDQLGTEALEWHPETIRQELEDAAGFSVPKHTFDRLMAGISLLASNYFWDSLPKFIQLTNILAGDDFDPRSFDPPDADEMAWAITEAMLLDPPDSEGSNPFSEEIRAYVGKKLGDEGFIRPPDILQIALEGDLSDRVSRNLSDDPAMFQAVYELQSAQTSEIERMIMANLSAMTEQLQKLPLDNGSVSDLKTLMDQGK
jgi:hypothetical protein